MRRIVMAVACAAATCLPAPTTAPAGSKGFKLAGRTSQGPAGQALPVGWKVKVA